MVVLKLKITFSVIIINCFAGQLILISNIFKLGSNCKLKFKKKSSQQLTTREKLLNTKLALYRLLSLHIQFRQYPI